MRVRKHVLLKDIMVCSRRLGLIMMGVVSSDPAHGMSILGNGTRFPQDLIHD